jgi:antitoxin component HigA of HigAB toxin-antitoxin module
MEASMNTPVRVLHTEADYRAALTEYERYFDDEPATGSPEGDRFELLGLVIARYEEERWPIAEADPLAVIRLVMEGRGYGQSDLAALLGSRSRASEILNGRRALSLDQIRKLSREWRIPAAALIGEPAAA